VDRVRTMSKANTLSLDHSPARLRALLKNRVYAALRAISARRAWRRRANACALRASAPKAPADAAPRPRHEPTNLMPPVQPTSHTSLILLITGLALVPQACTSSDATNPAATTSLGNGAAGTAASGTTNTTAAGNTAASATSGAAAASGARSSAGTAGASASGAAGAPGSGATEPGAGTSGIAGSAGATPTSGAAGTAPASSTTAGAPANGAAGTAPTSGNTAGASANSGAGPANSGTAGAGTTGSTASGTAGSAGTSPPAAGSGSCPGTLCESFESMSGPMLDATWELSTSNCTGTGMVSVDSTQAHSGMRSIRVQGAGGYCNHVFFRPKAPQLATGQPLFARFFMRLEKPLTQSHVTFLALRDEHEMKDLRMGGQSEILMWNRESDDATLPELSPTGIGMSVKPEVAKWLCVELSVDPKGSLQTWLDGNPVVGLTVEGDATPDVDAQWKRKADWAPNLRDIRFGWESYGNDANTLWFDDVALGTTRLGCGS